MEWKTWKTNKASGMASQPECLKNILSNKECDK